MDYWTGQPGTHPGAQGLTDCIFCWKSQLNDYNGTGNDLKEMENDFKETLNDFKEALNDLEEKQNDLKERQNYH